VRVSFRLLRPENYSAAGASSSLTFFFADLGFAFDLEAFGAAGTI